MGSKSMGRRQKCTAAAMGARASLNREVRAKEARQKLRAGLYLNTVHEVLTTDYLHDKQLDDETGVEVEVKADYKTAQLRMQQAKLRLDAATRMLAKVIPDQKAIETTQRKPTDDLTDAELAEAVARRAKRLRLNKGGNGRAAGVDGRAGDKGKKAAN